MLGIAGLPVSDELIMTYAGYLIFKGILYPIPTIIIAFSGSVCSISLSYFLGLTVGVPLCS
jgi:membrane protein DedA with SNARE-associated domain